MIFTAVTVQAPVLIRFSPPVGSSVRYKLVNKMEQKMPGGMPSTTITSTVDMTLKYLSRQGDKTTIESTNGKLKIDLPANSPMAQMKAQMEASGSGTKFQTVMDATGAVISTKALGKVAAGPGGTQGYASSVQGVALPNRAVRVGESWKSSFDIGKMMKSMAGAQAPGMSITGVLPITTKLVGVKKVNGKTLANLQFTMAGTMTMGMQGQKFATQMNTKGNSWIEVGTGVMHEVSTKGTSTTSFGTQKMVQNISTSMKKL